MECPKCHSNKTHKYGHQRGKQRYKCNECGRQFIESKIERGYDKKTKSLCLKMYLNGMGFRGIERVTGVHHTTIISWVKKVGSGLENLCLTEEIPEITQIDELQTFVKKNKIWVWDETLESGALFHITSNYYP
ncbi:MAG: IS1 family transposase [Moorea sp. SIO4E2]|nr:IS1 family transposase [Moorena sp. SIO4E2]